MSWIEKIWNENKEDQFKGFLLLLFSLIGITFVIITVVLRQFGIGTEILFSASFFLIFLSLSVIGLSFIKMFKSSLLILMLLSTEILVGYGPIFLGKVGIESPIKVFLPTKQDHSHTFHPMLAGVPKANYSSSKSAHHPSLGSVSHSGNGLRNNGTKLDFTKPHIAIFGGSTVYDIGVSADSNTWVSQLDGILENYTVSNNGVSGYSSAEHVIQTAFYYDRAGLKPICSIYYVGWNDIRNFGLNEIDNGYALFHMPFQYDSLRVRYNPNSPSAIFNIISHYFLRNELPHPKFNGEIQKDINKEHRFFKIVERNLESIVALNDSREIKTVIIAQMLNRAKLVDKDVVYDWIPFVYDSDVWSLQNRFNKWLKDLTQRKNIAFIHPNINEFNNTDFVDKGHFSDGGARKFSNMIATEVLNLCE